MYELWIEGFEITGNSAPDSLVMKVKSNIIKEAIQEYKETSTKELDIVEKSGNFYSWGCKFYIKEPK